jgi:2-iminobutanoate/2-iminopropanoate deaminase
MTRTTSVSTRRRVIAPADVPRSTRPLSPAVQLGDLLFVSGQTAAEQKGVAAQTRAVLEKIGGLLRAVGGDYRNVVRCGVYLADIRTFEEMNVVYREFFSSEHPARTTIECKMASPAVLVEIDCVASAETA